MEATGAEEACWPPVAAAKATTEAEEESEEAVAWQWQQLLPGRQLEGGRVVLTGSIFANCIFCVFHVHSLSFKHLLVTPRQEASPVGFRNHRDRPEGDAVHCFSLLVVPSLLWNFSLASSFQITL
jgi:hypothetical protein